MGHTLRRTRKLTTLGAAVGLALAPALLAPPPASAATVYAYIQSNYDQYYVYGSCGNGCDTYTFGPMSLYTFHKVDKSAPSGSVDGTYFEIVQDVTGYCLQFDLSGGDKVRNATCNGDASELWWASEEKDTSYQFINDDATVNFDHDGCLWNQDPPNEKYGYDILVKDCVSSQPAQQKWTFIDLPGQPIDIDPD
jgi:hypothetical protein